MMKSNKLKSISICRENDIPDAIGHEISIVIEKMGTVLDPALDGHDPNIVLSAFNRFHAAIIVTLTTRRELKECARSEAISLLENVDCLARTDYFNGQEKTTGK